MHEIDFKENKKFLERIAKEISNPNLSLNDKIDLLAEVWDKGYTQGEIDVEEAWGM